jgi:hypothetical protein
MRICRRHDFVGGCLACLPNRATYAPSFLYWTLALGWAYAMLFLLKAAPPLQVFLHVRENIPGQTLVGPDWQIARRET